MTKALGKQATSRTGEKPSLKLKPKWRLEHQDWLKLATWLDHLNLLLELPEEPSRQTLSERLPLVNFGVRNYRLFDDRQALYELLQRVRKMLDHVISRPRPAGIDHIEPDPFQLFLSALDQTTLSDLKRCPICQKYFLSRRKDQKACSRSCANVERQRQFRHRRPEYEKNRKRNRASKENREQMRQERVKSK